MTLLMRHYWQGILTVIVSETLLVRNYDIIDETLLVRNYDIIDETLLAKHFIDTGILTIC